MGYSQERFEAIEREYRAFLKRIGVEARSLHPHRRARRRQHRLAEPEDALVDGLDGA